MKKLLFAFLALLPFVAAAQQWEQDLGQGIIDLGGNAVCTNVFYAGTGCGLFIIGLFAFLAFAYYCFTVGLSSEVILPLAGLLLFSLAGWNVLPVYIGFGVVLVAGLFLYKAFSQVPNG